MHIILLCCLEFWHFYSILSWGLLFPDTVYSTISDFDKLVNFTPILLSTVHSILHIDTYHISCGICYIDIWYCLSVQFDIKPFLNWTELSCPVFLWFPLHAKQLVVSTACRIYSWAVCLCCQQSDSCQSGQIHVVNSWAFYWSCIQVMLQQICRLLLWIYCELLCVEQGRREGDGARDEVWQSASAAAVTATDACWEVDCVWTTICHSSVWYDLVAIHTLSQKSSHL